LGKRSGADFVTHAFVKNQYPNPMENQFSVTTGAYRVPLSLQQLVSNLVSHSLPAAHQKNTMVLNEIGQGIVLGAAMNKTITLIHDLLHLVVANSRNGEIHISAERLRGQVILKIQERNNNNGYALAFSIGTLERDAVSAGGYLSMISPQQIVTTICFSFPCQPVAA
jgi:hypothetical protein